MEVLILPPKTRKLIDRYLNITVAGKKFPCPYYQNIWKKRKKPVFAGKGTPEEIEKWAKKLVEFKPVLKSLSVEDLRFRLTLAQIGLDCSGLVTNLINQFLLEKHDRSLFQIGRQKNFDLRLKIRIIVRPRTNFSAKTLTSPPLAEPVKLNQARPGDLIKFGSFHVALISKVWKNKNKVKKIEYVHSTSDYQKKYGVKYGQIEIVNSQPNLESQNWTEVYQGTNWTQEDYLKSPSNNRGLRRIVL